MRPLLWKEMRDLRPWLLGTGGLALAIVLLCLSKRFEWEFLEMYVPLLPIPVLLAAAALGVGQVARERSSRTMDFLLSRPVSAATIVWSKFVTGTAALVLLEAALVGLSYIDPKFTDTSGIMVFRQSVGFWQLLLAVLPRAWCLYALALLVSVLVNRTAKAVAAVVVAAIGIAGLNAVYADLRPFSALGPWYLFFDDRPLATVLWLARDPALFLVTALGLSTIALAIAAAATLIFRRRPTQAMSTRTLVLSGCLLIGLAVISSKVDANALPVAHAVATLELKMDSRHDPVGMAANGTTVAMAAADSVAFLDFSEEAHPRKVGEAQLPLWDARKLIMADGAAYLIGLKKALPADEVQIARVRANGDKVDVGNPVVLGAETAIDSWDLMAVSGRYLFVDVIRKRKCQIEVYDVAGEANRLVATVVVDTMWDPPTGTPERSVNPGAMRMALGGRYLYVTSPAAFTVVDVADPEHPRVTNRRGYRSPFAFYYPYSAFPRELLTDGRRLLEFQFIPTIWGTYDLTDGATPKREGHGTALGAPVVGGDGVLYEPWHNGVMEFRARGGEFEGVRTMTDGYKGTPWVAASGDRVWTYKQVEDRRVVSEYRR